MKRIAPDHPFLRHRGWPDRRDPSSTRLVWAGTGVALRFVGASVSAELHGDGMVEVLLDGRLAHLLGPRLPGRIDIAERIPDGEHVVELRKRTEPVAGTAVFDGFLLPDDGFPLAQEPQAAPSLLFLGDSITCGYGNLAPSGTSPFEPQTEDVFRSYAGIASERLGLEFQASAWSGKGLQRNFDRDDSPTLPLIWRRTDPLDAASIVVAPARPVLAAIHLGTNDVFHDDPDWPSFVRDMVALGQDIRSTFPGLPLFLLDGPLLADGRLRTPEGARRPLLTRLRAALDLAAAQLADQAAATRFSLDPTSDDEPMGADGHPSLERQRIGGEELARALASFLDARTSSAA